ncbi:tRNA synthetases class II-domain-containing protein [Sordaria sp. MPI-SDFR-AT-0083]|nr:tRNA synthetases class II-domain-containing protein [Sordaria sp. MPI-SDFR-AT-0083]
MAQPRVSMRRLCRLIPSQNSRLYTSRTIPQWQSLKCLPRNSQRLLHTSSALASPSADKVSAGQKLREEWAQYSQFPSASKAADFVEGTRVTVHGFLQRRRVKSSKLVFADIQVENGPSVQVTATFKEDGSPEQLATKALRAVPLYSPVCVTGTVAQLNGSRVDLNLDAIQPLNAFPKDIIVSEGVQFPASARHLQIRFSDPLRSRLLARPQIGFQLRKTLNDLDFTEVETPILFKSTPEGAREFLVPTRRRGLAYALPQSPQQYKQILMSSGIRGYYQFARCFRDEDLRADRQPEFTQLDMEMGFATGEDVMRTVETLVTELLPALNAQFNIVKSGDDIYPVPKRGLNNGESIEDGDIKWPEPTAPFLRLTYDEAMTRFGIDKPDLRIPFEFHRVEHILPAQFVSMITHTEQPIVEVFRIRPQLDGETTTPGTIAEFVDKLMDQLPKPLAKNPDGAPAALMFNSKKPLCGLSSLGFEGFDALTSMEEFSDLEDGDVLVFQARKNAPFQGEGSTALGVARTHFYHSFVSAGLLPRSFDLKFLWVVNFPMFTPDDGIDPGQGGQAGFKATHHPFTAPLTEDDVELLATDPLKARADHYDLVVNGVELGGGSRRIHLSSMQEYVMRNILKMTDAGLAQFSHLLEALRAGCPPHAGFALGFDRLVAVLTHTDSVRDVIAFPKSMKGEDLTVKSPSRMTTQQLETYHLAIAKKEEVKKQDV